MNSMIIACAGSICLLMSTFFIQRKTTYNFVSFLIVTFFCWVLYFFIRFILSRKKELWVLGFTVLVNVIWFFYSFTSFSFNERGGNFESSVEDFFNKE